MLIAIPMSNEGAKVSINQAYVDYVAKSGLQPLLVTPSNDLKVLASICDGLLIPGGIDIDPIFYGEDNYSCMSADPEKDDFERQLLHLFIDQNKPIFGICRGMQLIVRELAIMSPLFRSMTTYEQHIDKHSLANALNVARCYPTHSVKVLRHLLYNDLSLGTRTSEMFVNSMHHQALMVHYKELKKGDVLSLTHDFENDIKVSFAAVTTYQVPKYKGYSSFMVEGININGWSGGGVRGVQWHPEELKDYELLKNFFTKPKAIALTN